jgi:hypothetical protein
MAILFLGVSLWAAIHFRSAEFVVLAIGVWMLILATVILQLNNQASSWTPESQTTEEFIRISLRRCRSRLKALRSQPGSLSTCH